MLNSDCELAPCSKCIHYDFCKDNKLFQFGEPHHLFEFCDRKKNKKIPDDRVAICTGRTLNFLREAVKNNAPKEDILAVIENMYTFSIEEIYTFIRDYNKPTGEDFSTVR